MPQTKVIDGWIVRRNDDGTFDTLGPANAQPQMPADPTFQYKGPKADADLNNTVVTTQGNAIDNQIKDATAGAVITKANREASTAGLPEGFMWSPENSGRAIPIPGYSRQGLSPEIRKGAIDAYNDAMAIEGIVNDLRAKFKAGPGKTHGMVASLRDYLPTDANKRFDDAGQRARGYVKRSLGFTGGEGNTAAESSSLYDPYLPKASDRDAQILDKIAALEELGQKARAKAISTLGGVPDANGNVTPQQDDRDKTVWNQTYFTGGQGPNAAPPGSGTQQLQTPPEMQAELQTYIQQNAGHLDPQALRSYVDGLYVKYGFGANPGNDEWARRAAQAGNQGGTINTQIPGPTTDLSMADRLRNAAANNPLGAGVVGWSDALTGGLVSAAAPDDTQALSEAQPVGTTVGQIGGSMLGTKGLGLAGGATIGRAIPLTMGGGARAALMRDLGTDAAYSAFYGSNQGQDAGLSALTGTLGSLAGRGVGKVAGKAIGGLDLPQAVQALRAKGMSRFTTGQQLGGIAKGTEDAITSSILGVGDIVNARRLEGFQDFNRAAFNDPSFAKVGARATALGEEGTSQLIDQIGNAYDNATAGVNVPLDPQFLAEVAAARAKGKMLPADLSAKFDLALENRLKPIEDLGAMTGQDFQQGFRGLKSYKAETTAPGFEEQYRGLLGDVMGSMTEQMKRGGGDKVVAGLQDADTAYRRAKTLEAAVKAARNGGRTGEVQLFAPSQLVDAGWASKTKYGGERPFADLADAGQEVLPSRLPDSGTAKRLATQIATTTGLAGAGAGADYYAGDGLGGGSIGGLSLAMALALGGTKAGQKALEKAIFVRPDAIADAGRRISAKSGIFGRGAIPLALPLAGQ